MKNIGVVGLGQIGGSIAKALVREKIDVIGYDTDYSTRLAARASGIAIAENLNHIVLKSHIIFCCVSISANKDVISELLRISEAVSNHPTISDVASYKKGTLPEDEPNTQLIPGHPMAGSHGFGFGSAADNLFKGAVWNLITQDNLDTTRLLDLIEIIFQLGSTVHFCSQTWHDETVSLVSGMPHVLALTLGALTGAIPSGNERLTLAAGSFKGATRVLLSDPSFFSDLLRYNKPTLLPLVRSFRDKLDAVERALRDDNYQQLNETIASARNEIESFCDGDWSVSIFSVPATEIRRFTIEARDKGWLITGAIKDSDVVRFEIRQRGCNT